MSTRVTNGTSHGAAGNMTRRDQLTTERDPQGGATVKGTTISFTSPATIADSGNGFGAIRAGDMIEVRGSTLNSRQHRVATAAAGSLTVVPALIQTEAAGPLVIVTRVP